MSENRKEPGREEGGGRLELGVGTGAVGSTRGGGGFGGTLTQLSAAPGHVKWSCRGCHPGKEGAWA